VSFFPDSAYFNLGGVNALRRYGLTERSRKKSHELRQYNRTLLATRLNRRREREKERFGSGFNNRIDYAPESQKRARKTTFFSGWESPDPGYIETPYRSGVGSVKAHVSSSRCLPVLYETRKLVKCVIMLDGGHSRHLPPTSHRFGNTRVSRRLPSHLPFFFLVWIRIPSHCLFPAAPLPAIPKATPLSSYVDHTWRAKLTLLTI